MEQQGIFAYNYGMNILLDVNFAELCKELRNKGKYTQEEMAKKLGVSRRTYQYWENGKWQPNVQAALRIFTLRDEIERNSKKLSSEKR